MLSSLLKILHFTMHSAALPGSLARQPCPAALPGSLAWQFDQFRPDLMRARSPCFRHCSKYCISPCIQQPCSAAFPGSLARQPCLAVRPISTGFDARARSLRSHRTVLQWQVTKLRARAAVLTGLNLFVVRFCYHRSIPMMRFAAYYSFHYWLQFELAAYNALIVGRNLPRIVPV
jgi:hypothetical protein